MKPIFPAVLAAAIFCGFTLSSSAQDPVYTPPRGQMLNKKKKESPPAEESSEDSSAPQKTGNPLLDKIEAKLGHSLSSEQRQEVLKAAQRSQIGQRKAQGQYVQATAKAAGISEEDVRKMLSKGDQDIIPRIEAKVGQPLTPDQKDAIQKADQEKQSLVGPAKENLAKEVARITDLSEDDAKTIVR